MKITKSFNAILDILISMEFYKHSEQAIKDKKKLDDYLKEYVEKTPYKKQIK